MHSQFVWHIKETDKPRRYYSFALLCRSEKKNAVPQTIPLRGLSNFFRRIELGFLFDLNRLEWKWDEVCYGSEWNYRAKYLNKHNFHRNSYLRLLTSAGYTVQKVFGKVYSLEKNIPIHGAKWTRTWKVFLLFFFSCPFKIELFIQFMCKIQLNSIKGFL